MDSFLKAESLGTLYLTVYSRRQSRENNICEKMLFFCCQKSGREDNSDTITFNWLVFKNVRAKKKKMKRPRFKDYIRVSKVNVACSKFRKWENLTRQLKVLTHFTFGDEIEVSATLTASFSANNGKENKIQKDHFVHSLMWYGL